MNEVMQIRAASWAAMIKQRNDSGLTIREWCAANSWKRWCSVLSGMTGFQAIYIYCGKCDLRKGIDGLATLVKEQFRLDPFQKNVLFLFCGCRTDRFKGLVWEGDGFCLLYKRIEAGRLRWLRSQEEAARISQEELHLLLTGMTILERSSIRNCNCTEVCWSAM